MAAADIGPGTLLLVERRFLPMPTAVECGLAGGIGPVRTVVVGGEGRGGVGGFFLLKSTPLVGNQDTFYFVFFVN